jgi:hypothetical protein
MGDIRNLYWHVQIGEDVQAERITSPRLNVYDGLTLNNTWSPQNITGLTYVHGYRVYVKFEDDMGNISPVWIYTGLTVKYSDAAINSVSNLRAKCNDDGNEITVSWDEPGEYLYPELVIRRYRASPFGDIFESVVTYTFDNQKSGGYSFAVPLINAGNVRSGNGVTNVYGYELTVITHNIAGHSEPLTVRIYNIPGMDVNGTNTILLGDTITNELTESAGKNFVMTRNITIDNHIPIANFQGRFYGNGHTITINGINVAADMGLFGVVSGDAVVRDLTVEYGDITAIRSGELFFGGLAGRLQGNAVIRNAASGPGVQLVIEHRTPTTSRIASWLPSQWN